MMIILKLIYFMLPAYIANMAPVFGRGRLEFLAVPIDFGKKWKGMPILGKNKTWRGVILGVIASVIVFSLQKYLYSFESFKSISMIDYSTASLALGILLGFGALFGDSFKSFFKRRRNIKPGQPWIPFDEIDFSIGSLFFASIVYFPGWKNAALIVVISALGHILINHIGYYLKIRKEKW